MNIHIRAGQIAKKQDLVDVKNLVNSYYSKIPNISDFKERVVFGTSGHRGSSLNTTFNEKHIASIVQAICEYRIEENIKGPLFMGIDTHLLSLHAQNTAIQVLTANKVNVFIDSRNSYTPTPAISRAIIRYNYEEKHDDIADGIIITPSHNPPQDGGIKYNSTNGGPAGTHITNKIANRANEIIKEQKSNIKHIPLIEAKQYVKYYDFLQEYISALPKILNIKEIQKSNLKIGVDPLGGASLNYWQEIKKSFKLNLEIFNPVIDPQWKFMTLDWDGKIRMDCSSPYAMSSLLRKAKDYDIVIGNDADADRHGVVTADGLMNPNDYLASAIYYLLSSRTEWSTVSNIGKTLVSSSIIDNISKKFNRKVIEVPVGFKWFVDDIINRAICFAGEESAGATFLKKDGSPWTTDKDGILMCLLGVEMMATTKKTPHQIYSEIKQEFGSPSYSRVDAKASIKQKKVLSNLKPEDINIKTLAGDAVIEKFTSAKSNNAPINGFKIVTNSSWFAARPSGTEDLYKIYAESFKGTKHLKKVQTEAQQMINMILHHH